MSSFASPRNWVWLALAGTFLFFANGRYIIPVAAWLGPVFLVRFLRNQPVARGIVSSYALLATLSIVAWRGMMPFSGLVYYVAAVGAGVAYVLPCAADRMMAPRFAGFSSTLVLPLAWVVMEFAGTTVLPWGSWGATGYTQTGNLPLMQVVSVTGIFGVPFLIGWLAATVNWAWERHFEFSVCLIHAF